MAERTDKTVHQARFLAAFAESASVGVAAKWAGIRRGLHYEWLENDPDYPARFAAALRRASRVYHDEATRRAVKGIRKAVRYKGKVVTWDTEYSDTLLLALLKAHEPELFRERSSIEHSGPDGGPITLATLDKLIAERRGSGSPSGRD